MQKNGQRRWDTMKKKKCSSTSSGSSISMKQEYIVKPEEILQMDNNEVYIYKGATSELIHTRLVKPVN